MGGPARSLSQLTLEGKGLTEKVAWPVTRLVIELDASDDVCFLIPYNGCFSR